MAENRFTSEWYQVPGVTNPLDDTTNAAEPDGAFGWGYGGFPVVQRKTSAGLGKYRTQGNFRYIIPRPTTTLRKNFNSKWHNGDLWTQQSTVHSHDTFTYYLAYSTQWSQGTWPGWTAAGDTPVGAWLSDSISGAYMPMISTWHTLNCDISVEFEVQPVDVTANAMQFRFALVMFDPQEPTGTIAKPRTGWTATASTTLAGQPASNVLDGNTATYWQSATAGPLPQTITIDMNRWDTIGGLKYLGRQDNSNGRATVAEIYTSIDGINWGAPVLLVTWANDTVEKTALWPPTLCRYVQIKITGSPGGVITGAAEINLISQMVGNKKIYDSAILQLTRNSNNQTKRHIGLQGVVPFYVNLARVEQLAAEVHIARAWGTQGGGTLFTPGWRINDVRGEMIMHSYPAPLGA